MKGLVWSFLLLCFLLPIAKALIGVLFRKLVEVIDTYGLIVVTLYLVFLPFKLLNSLQMFLQKPWRYFQRYNRAPDKIKKALRVLNVIVFKFAECDVLRTCNCCNLWYNHNSIVFPFAHLLNFKYIPIVTYFSKKRLLVLFSLPQVFDFTL